MGLSQLNFEGKNKVEVAIDRLRYFEPPEGYYLAFSGGKDSCVIKALADGAGVKYDAHYSQGGIDPPELVQFIRKYHPDVSMERSGNLWKVLEQKGMPRRQSRWCCEFIKEQAGSGRWVLTGIRWQESPRRQNRRMLEYCLSDGTKLFANFIIDWTEKDVWEYIVSRGIPYCSLYDEGFKRLGCVLCPMQTAKQTQIELKRWPKLADAWKRACYRYWEKGSEGTKRWTTAEDMWQWWLSRKGEPKVDEAQCIMFDN